MERLRIDAEISGGDLGAGGRLGSNYLFSDRTNLYLNYALENERTDNGLRARRGNLVSGVKTRFSDSTSVYVEQRFQDTESMHGLTARDRHQPDGERALEHRRQRRFRHVVGRVDRRRDGT